MIRLRRKRKEASTIWKISTRQNGVGWRCVTPALVHIAGLRSESQPTLLNEVDIMALEMKYFVLKPKGDSIHAQASRLAMLTYANVVRAHDPELAKELEKWVQRELKHG